VFAVCLDTFSQIDQPNRFEKERKFNDTDFTLISLKADGLALIREKREYKKGNQTWEVLLLDTTLQEAEPIEFEVNHSHHLVGFEQTPGEVYFLFNESELRGYMTLVTIDIKTKNVKLVEIKPELNLRLTQFCKVGGNFVFGGFVNRESALLLYNPTSDNLKVIPGFFLKETDLVDMRVNQNQTFNTILIERTPNRVKKIIFRTFDDSGKQILEDITSIDEDIELQTSISSTLEREDLAILGTWGKLNSKQASGFYAIPVNPFTDLKINRVHFGALQHYLDYLKPNKAAKIKLKSLEAIEAGKIPDFADHVMPFKIVEYKDGFLLLAESYIPSSTINQYQGNMPYSTNYPYYSQNGGYYPPNRIYSPFTPTYGNNVQNAEESKTIESVVVAFDGSGNILWDYSVPLTNMKMPSLEQVCDFALIENKIHFLYKNESELRIKTINLDDQGVVESAEKIKLSNPLDELRSESEQIGTVKHWFGKNFYVWGYQSVRNKAKAESRQVLYINKVVVH
jgi:hypothetical protein